MSNWKQKLWALEMIKLAINQQVEKGVYRVESYMIQYATLTRLRWRTLPAAKGATYYMGVNLKGDHWTGSILRSSSQDLINLHRLLRRFLVVFKVSFRGEVVTPGVTATSVLTSAKCQRQMSSVWPWSGMPKVCLYNTFLGSLRHSPPRMKNQHGLNEEKKHTGKIIISHLSACDVTCVVSLDTNNLKHKSLWEWIKVVFT